uniref:Aminoacyl-tRNA synthetase class Ia domain-containing protein n=1 Tax=Panagrolaimus sp. ES5 TaxID=591445 RepID=A0AC34G5D4_9BILA
MPYSTGCATPLSNFEAGQNYKDVPDPAAFVAFPLVDQPNRRLIAWTTTPWTLPSNLALCVHPDLDYVAVKPKDSDVENVVLESAVKSLYKKSGEYTIVEKFKGSTLKGKKYIPPFSYFENLNTGKFYHVLTALCVHPDLDYVAVKPKDSDVENVVLESAVKSLYKKSGEYTIVEKFKGSTLKGKKYIPPFSYFESLNTGKFYHVLTGTFIDFATCLENGVITKDMKMICPVDEKGCFTSEVTDFSGQYVKDADKQILKNLKDRGLLVKQDSCVHSYPFCWRSDTPLLYKAVPSWFIRVESIIPQLLENNEQTYWVPSFVKDKRFANWLRDARDWAVSRNRFWGTPINLWVSEDMEEIVCPSSIAELEKLTDMKMICPVDEKGCFTSEVTDFSGQYVKDADKQILKNLKDRGLLVKQDSCVHSYPFCWRSDTPLLYKAVPSWFIRVESEDMEEIVCPASIAELEKLTDKRFANWLRDARDWAVSRNRFWGTPINLWVSEDMEEI